MASAAILDVSNTAVIERIKSNVVSVQPHNTVIVSGSAGPQGPQGLIGLTGPQGVPGAVGSTNYSSIVAGVVLSSHRVVMVNSQGKLIPASSLSELDAYKIIGITTQSGVADAEIIVQHSGILEEPGWFWDTSLDIFLGVDGMLTQTPPTVGFSCIIGNVLSPTKIFINVQPPIILG